MTGCWCGGRVGYREAFPEGTRRLECLDSVNHDWKATGRPDEVTKLYITGPMSNYPQNNYPAFNEAGEYLRDRGYIVLNPVEHNPPGRVHYVDLLREDLRLMLDCQGVALLPGWWESQGARAEVNVAGLLKMPCRELASWPKLLPEEEF